MSYNYGAVFTKAKTIVAAIGSTLTAVMVALTAIQLVLDDGKVDVGEVSTLVGTAVTLVGTVYAVWRTENRILKGIASATPLSRSVVQNSDI